jgi:prenylcysteine alpha-carboxyl methylesterase
MWKPILPWAWATAKLFLFESLYIAFVFFIFFRTVIFGCTVMSGVFVLAAYYLVTSRGMRRIKFTPDGTRLDVFWPADGGRDLPLVICVTGGAWIIGKRFWFLAMARAITGLGFVVVMPDYRQYPWATAPGMVNDVVAAIDWTDEAVNTSGALLQGMVDPARVYLVGQSAGAHLTSVALQRIHDRGRRTPVRGYIGVSGIYDIVGMQRHLHSRGLHARVLRRIFGATNDEEFAANCALRSVARGSEVKSGTVLPAQAVARRPAGSAPPPSLPTYAIFLHGRQDLSAPSDESAKMAEAWRRQQGLGHWEEAPAVTATESPARSQRGDPPALMLRIVDGTHTSLLVEDALAATAEMPSLLDSLLQLDAWNTPTQRRRDGVRPASRVIFEWQRKIANFVSAF